MADETKTSKAPGRDHLRWSTFGRFVIIIYREQSSQILELEDGQEIIVGRRPEAELFIDDSQVSRRHSRLWRSEGHVYVEDLGSTNGTRVNGVPIHGRQRLGPGDEVEVGPASLVLSSLSISLGQHRIMAERDFEDRLEAEVDRARRYRKPVSLAMLRFRGRSEEIRRHLLAIAPSLRRMDMLAACGPREYALLFPEADSSTSQVALRRLFSAMDQQARKKVVMGVASYPADGHSSGMLHEVARRRLRQARRGLLSDEEAPPASDGSARVVVAESQSMALLMKMAGRIAGFDIAVLVMGETGCGKQVMAEEIHKISPRAKGPLVQVNCAALPPALLENELFGHERGAFTGADSRHRGYVEAAEGGTLFLDEIGELPGEAQPKLLHLLENKTFTRVGGTRPLRGDVRIIAATNRDLEADVQAGRFREDLYFRLSAFVLHVPPLRDRLEDIEPLTRQFCAEFAASLGQPIPVLSERAMTTLMRHHWPGNVRQLRNAIERAVVLAEGDVIDDVHLPERVLARAGVLPSSGVEDLVSQLAEMEMQLVRAALEESNGNQSEAARRLGVSRRSLIYRMKKYGLG